MGRCDRHGRLRDAAAGTVVIPQDVRLKTPPQKIAQRGLRILVFGDNGTGDANQTKVAAAMQKFCAQNECDFGLMLGDNFYPEGVQSLEDPQFSEKFEKPYAALGIPLCSILGEHDWGRRGKMYNWKAQIDYTQRSSIWHMPSDVYSITYGALEILALNTNALPGSREQIPWLASKLEKSRARWKLVMGHKPIHSYGYHGDTDFMISDVLPLLCGKVDLYLSGHEHNEQYLRADYGLPLLVSGSGGKLRPDRIKGPHSRFASDVFGFSYLQVKDGELIVQIVSAGGGILCDSVISRCK
jgi:tartrate-resistant acid phosphatase type 5